jgi:hypothetical protein
VSEFDLFEKALLGMGTGGIAVVGLFKLISLIRKEQAGQAGDGAVAAQFKALQDQIDKCQSDNKLLREAHNRLDAKLHVQQRTITRMEMLLRQFSGLVQEHGIPVPAYMQTELEALIVSNEERAMVIGDQLMNRRATDK